MGVIYMDRNHVPISEGIAIESQYNIVHPETFALKMDKLLYKEKKTFFQRERAKRQEEQ